MNAILINYITRISSKGNLANPLNGTIHHHHSTETNILVTRTLNTTRETQFWPSLISPDLNRPSVERKQTERTIENTRPNTFEHYRAQCPSLSNRPLWESYMLRSGSQTAISHVQMELLRGEELRRKARGERSEIEFSCTLMQDRGSASRLLAR